MTQNELRTKLESYDLKGATMKQLLADSVEQRHATVITIHIPFVSVTTDEDATGASVRTRGNASVHPVRRY